MKTKRWWIWIVTGLLLTGLLMGCAPDEEAPAAPPPNVEEPVETPDEGELPLEEREPVEEVEPEGAPEDVQDAVLDAIAEQLDADLASITGLELRPTEWSDSCLGWGGPAESCLQAITPGYEGSVLVDSIPYTVRTNETGEEVRLRPTAVLNAQRDLAQQLGVTPPQVALLEWEMQEWPDACLGLEIEEQLCAQVITPGYRVSLEYQGRDYVYRTDREGNTVLLAETPEPEVENPIAVWVNEDEGSCETAIFGPDMVVFGPCDGPLMAGRYAAPERQLALVDFMNTYAPFTAQTAAGEVEFRGGGDEEATAAEQRTIAEWARLAATEAQTGQPGSTEGLLFTWHREGGIAGFCDDLTVYRTGLAIASSCKGEETEAVGEARLEGERLARAYEWLDTYAPFEYEETDPAEADAMTVGMIFYGVGGEEAPDEVVQEMLLFASTLYHELSAASK